MTFKNLLPLTLTALTGFSSIACNRTDDVDSGVEVIKNDDEINSLHRIDNEENSKESLNEAKHKKIKLKSAMAELHKKGVISDEEMFAYEKQFNSSSYSNSAEMADLYFKLGTASPISLQEDIRNKSLDIEQAKTIWQLRKNPHIEELRRSLISHDLSFSDEEIAEIEKTDEVSNLIAQKKKELYQKNKNLLGAKRKKLFDYAFKLGIDENKIYDAFTVETELLFNKPKKDFSLEEVKLKAERRIAGIKTEFNIISLLQEAILNDFANSNAISATEKEELKESLFSDDLYDYSERKTISAIKVHEEFSSAKIEAQSVYAKLNPSFNRPIRRIGDAMPISLGFGFYSSEDVFDTGKLIEELERLDLEKKNKKESN